MQKKSLQYPFAVILLFATIASVATAESDNAELAQNILEKADQIRFPRESFQVDVNISSSVPGQKFDCRTQYKTL